MSKARIIDHAVKTNVRNLVPGDIILQEGLPGMFVVADMPILRLNQIGGKNIKIRTNLDRTTPKDFLFKQTESVTVYRDSGGFDEALDVAFTKGGWIDIPDEEEGDSDTLECEICGGPLVKLGVLGSSLHLKCRDCGAQQSWRIR